MARLVLRRTFHQIGADFRYRSQYWAGLEKSWNGYLLDSITTVLNRAANFEWQGERTIVRLLESVYEKGVRVCGKAKAAIEQRLHRAPELRWWDVTIYPKMV